LNAVPVLMRLRVLLREQGGLIASLVANGGVPVAGAPGSAVGAMGPTHLESAGPAQVTANGPAVVAAADSAQVTPVGPAQVAAAGPRAGEHADEYELLIEAIYEGYLLHYGTPRVVHPPEADLGLLAGDQLYALGLARLVALGDLAAVVELADVIALTALAQGGGHDELASAVWAAGARAIGWGSSEAHRRAKALVHAGDVRALEALLAAAAVEVPAARGLG
jgi:hypothetical protein